MNGLKIESLFIKSNYCKEYVEINDFLMRIWYNNKYRYGSE